MTFYGAKELEEGFRTVRKNTIVIAEEIPAERYGFKAAAEVRTVGEMLAHVAASTAWHMQVHGDRLTHIEFSTFGELMARAHAREKALGTKEAILAALISEGDAFAAFLGGLSDSTLAERVSFPAPLNNSKSRFEMLLSGKEHEMHHRAQLMLIERLLGMVPHLTKQREAYRAQLTPPQAGAAR